MLKIMIYILRGIKKIGKMKDETAERKTMVLI